MLFPIHLKLLDTYVSASLQNLHVVDQVEHPHQAFPTYCP